MLFGLPRLIEVLLICGMLKRVGVDHGVGKQVLQLAGCVPEPHLVGRRDPQRRGTPFLPFALLWPLFLPRSSAPLFFDRCLFATLLPESACLRPNTQWSVSFPSAQPASIRHPSVWIRCGVCVHSKGHLPRHLFCGVVLRRRAMFNGVASNITSGEHDFHGGKQVCVADVLGGNKPATMVTANDASNSDLVKEHRYMHVHRVVVIESRHAVAAHGVAKFFFFVSRVAPHLDSQESCVASWGLHL